jgi:hypothetical protein
MPAAGAVVRRVGYLREPSVQVLDHFIAIMRSTPRNKTRYPQEPGLLLLMYTFYDRPGVRRMNDVLIYIGSGIAIVMGVFHVFSTKQVLKDFEGLSFDSARLLLGLWNGVGFMVFYLGAIPLALVLTGANDGTCATVVGISAVALSGLAVANFVTYRPTKNRIAKAIAFVFAVIAILIGLGTFL